MTRDELEFSISQYLDGTLAVTERDALDERLATDAEARAILADYQSLQGVLASSPVPDVKWEQFAAQISAAVSREELPAQSYKLSAWLRPARLALAASLLLGIGVAVTLMNNRGAGPTTTSDPVSIVRVDANTSESPTTVSAQPIVITIGPPPASSSDTRIVMHVDGDEGIVRRPSCASIASAGPVAQDTSLTPY